MSHSEGNELPRAERGRKSNRKREGRVGEDRYDARRRQTGSGHDAYRHRLGGDGCRGDGAVRVLPWWGGWDWSRNIETGADKGK